MTLSKEIEKVIEEACTPYENDRGDHGFRDGARFGIELAFKQAAVIADDLGAVNDEDEAAMQTWKIGYAQACVDIKECILALLEEKT